LYSQQRFGDYSKTKMICMLNNDFTFLLFVISSVIAIGFALLVTRDKKKVQPAYAKGQPDPSLHLVQSSQPDFPPALIDRPLLELADEAVITIEKEASIIDGKFERVEDEESALLKAAEIVVEKVQDVIGHIASNPPNPEEVTSKIRAIVNPYTIFRDTEYFDAINSFIAISVERDCGIRLSKEQLLALWD
jgi:hypothetical protein